MSHRFAILLVLFFASTSARAQTRPRVEVPKEDASQSQAIIQELLKSGRIIRSSEVKRGMKGVARSVFQGTTIEEFPIEVIGVLERVQGGSDIVLIRVTGGTVVKRQSGIVAGMSGSPVYINGKMLGAIALGWGFPKEPIGGVTPITQMIQSSLPDATRREVVRPATSTAPPGNVPPQSSTPLEEKLSYRPKEPLRLAGRDIKRMIVSRDSKRIALSGPRENATMTMRPATTLLQISGMREQTLPLLRRIFEPYQLTPVIGPASEKNVPSPPLKPGSSMGVQLVSGDMDQTAVGTVTFRWGNRILGFGHPMFGQGAASIPIASSFVHDIFPSYERSFKLASPIKVVGALQQDTQFAVGGTLGAPADTIPMSVTLADASRGIRRTYKVKVMKDPVLTPQLIGMVASEAIETTLGLSSDKTVRVRMTMEIDGAPKIVRSNLLYTQGPITPAALADLQQTLIITQSNEFARGSIKSVALSVSIDDSRRMATIKSMVANRNKVRAGETVQITVQLEPIATPNKYITRTFNFKVPADAPDGEMRIVAAPGSAFWGAQVRVGGAPPEPSNLQELVAAWNKVGSFNELMVQASTAKKFLQIDDKKLPNVPPSFSNLLRSSRATGVAAYNEVETQSVTTDTALVGAQFLTIPVEGVGYHERDGSNENAPAASDDIEQNAGVVAEEDTPLPTDGADDDMPQSQSMLMRGMPLRAGDEWIDELAKPSGAVLPGAKQSTPNNALDLLRPINYQTTVVPRREPSDRPVTPTITSPTPQPSPGATATPKPTPTPTPKPTAKSVARPAQSWVQGSAAEFLKGDLNGALITNRGEIRPAPPSSQIATTAEPFVWSIAGDNSGNTYLGASNPARILKIDAAGKQSVFYKGTEIVVNALTSDKNGNIYAGISPGGAVLRFDAKGKKTVVLDTRDTFVWAMNWDDKGRLLVATGGEKGRLYRVDDPATSNGAATKPIAQVPQNHIRAVSARGDEIFLGTGDEGVLWRVAADGTLKALFQVPERNAQKVSAPTSPAAAMMAAESASPVAGSGEILAVVAAPDGVYFGTSGNGTLYRWRNDDVEAIYPAPQQAIYAISRADDGTLYVATGNTGIVYRINPGASISDTRAARLLEPQQLQALALAFSPDGKNLLVGTGNNGAAHRIALQDAPTGVFTSPVFDAQNIVRWGALRLIGNDVSLETRSGNTQKPDASWSQWQAAAGSDGELQTSSPSARYLQYRASLSPAPADSQLARVEVVFRARNSGPQVELATSLSGSFWSGKQSVKWTGQDADKDTLRYRLWLSSDDGKNWKEVETKKATDASFDLDTTKWPDGIYRVKVEASDEERNPEDPLRAQNISQPLVIDNTESAIAEVSLEKAGEDGSLRLKLTATDALSPIAGAEWRWKMETSTASSGKNDATDDKKDDDEKSEATTITEQTTTTVTTTITSTVEGAAGAIVVKAPDDDKEKSKDDEKSDKEEQEWRATAAVDGIFDSRRETAVALLPAPAVDLKSADKDGKKEKPLPTAIEVRVIDASGNSAMKVVPLP